MNKIFFITFVACSVVFSFSAHAQSGKQHRNFDREAFFAKKNAFITAEMGLTPEEAASFVTNSKKRCLRPVVNVVNYPKI